MEGSIVRSDQDQRRREGMVFLVLFALTIPAANWLIGHVGTSCVTPQGPCVVPWGGAGPDGAFGRDAGRRGAGVARSGAAAARHGPLGAGDPVRQRAVGAARAGLAGDRLGDGVSLSEFADLAVYTPLARRRLVAAVVASSFVGLVVDSIVFLWLAFGSLDFLAGQVVGKSWMVLLSIPFVAWLRRRDERLGIKPA